MEGASTSRKAGGFLDFCGIDRPNAALLMSIQPNRKWLTAIPLPWREDPAFWEREAGVLCLGLRANGVEARFVTLGEPKLYDDRPLINGTAEQWKDPAWWKQWGAEAVVLYSWAAPAFEPMARAIKASGSRLIVRMDSDGISSPRVAFWRFLSVQYFGARDAGKSLPPLRAVVSTLLFRFVPRFWDRPLLQHLGHADLILIESPIACQRLLRLFRSLKREDIADKVCTMPAQIRDEFIYDPAIPKQRRILAVGRWDATQKDAPMLVRVLGAVLAQAPDYTALVAGAGEEGLRQLLAQLPATVRDRIQIVGRQTHRQLWQLYQESQMLFFPSRYEGFPNAAAEALSCGCSIVGPARIASLNYCASHSSGTLAFRRTGHDLADALGAEVAAWRDGEREPRAISAHWHPRVSARSVAARIMEKLAARLRTKPASP